MEFQGKNMAFTGGIFEKNESAGEMLLRFARDILCPHLPKSALIVVSKRRFSMTWWILITVLTSVENKI